MLESHPMLPFQGASGMTALTAHEDYGKGSPRAKGSGKGKPQSKSRSDRQDYWSPQAGKSSGSRSSHKGWYGWSDYSKPKQGKDKGQAKGQWKERDHDKCTNWKKDDDHDNQDSWGQWGSGPWAPSRTPSSSLFGGSNKGSNQQTQPQNPKGKGHSHIQPVFICDTCSCALGCCSDCPACKTTQFPRALCGNIRFLGRLSFALVLVTTNNSEEFVWYLDNDTLKACIQANPPHLTTRV